MSVFDTIVVHCSDSPWGCAREIEDWHKRRGFTTIGYHFVIGNAKPVSNLHLPSLEGHVEYGRYLDGDSFVEDNEVGAHALGYNNHSIGICVIGKRGTFTTAQMDSLKNLLIDLCRQYGIKAENVIGHNETADGKKQGKTCPDFEVQPFRTWIKGRI